MSEKIEPALTPEQWRDSDRTITEMVGALPERAEDMVSLVALANAALPDSDHRKITREMVGRLRWAASHAGESNGGAQQCIDAIADALESYLPPENVKR